MKKSVLSFIVSCCFAAVAAQQYVVVPPDTSDEELLQSALSVKPSKRQINWQEMEYYGFIHFGINTFTGQEWSDGTNPPSLFNPTELDAEQWVKTFKNA
ncbi:MAG: alpha-1,3/4-fucosidase, partial [Paludibacter sp.]|nr:alpha-1,3/4-fucosidase [Paludibacter sp.]